MNITDVKTIFIELQQLSDLTLITGRYLRKIP
jgi:hypothetical protein